MSKKCWLAMRDEYKRLLQSGLEDVAARDAAYASASAAAAKAAAEEAAIHTLPRIVLRLSNISRGKNIKACVFA